MTKKNGEIEVVYQKVADLVPYAQNARTHTEEQIELLTRSIQEFGWTVPVLVDEHRTIVAGHARVLAAQRLGIVNVPTITLRGLTEEQRRLYVIADNQLAISGSGWDLSKLESELRHLATTDIDLELSGFDLGELDDYLKGSQGATNSDAAQAATGSLGNPIISYTLVFDDQHQQDVFFEFVRRLKAVDPDAEMTLAARLTTFLKGCLLADAAEGGTGE